MPVKFLWCHTPRFYWLTWSLEDGRGYTLDDTGEVTQLHLEASLPLSEMLKTGWLKVDPDQLFPTFTTGRPSGTPGRKPAGIRSCNQEELQRWEAYQ